MPERRQLPEIERTLRGMERCGYRIYAIPQGPDSLGVVELHPDDATGLPRTERKWRMRWLEILATTGRRTIAEHLAETGRTQAIMQEKAQYQARIGQEPWTGSAAQ